MTQPINAIVAVTQNWGIGNQGKLLVRNPKDLTHFKELTQGATVIMGRKTYESLPGGALPNRRNIVITAHPEEIENKLSIEIATSPKEAIELAQQTEQPVWIIGGEQIYKALLDYCEHIEVTHHQIEVAADTFFPNLNELSQFQITKRGELQQTSEGIPFSYITYSKMA